MLPKERMLAALRHQEPDRVPIGEIAVDWDIVEKALAVPRFTAASGTSGRPCGTAGATR